MGTKIFKFFYFTHFLSFVILALFLMRDSKGDREIPEEVKNDFEDQEPFLKEKLKTLKDMIVDRFPVSNASYKNI